MSSDGARRRKVADDGTIAVGQLPSSPPPPLLLVLLVVVTGLGGAAAVDCLDGDWADPTTVLACKYLPPNAYVPIALLPSTINSSDVATLCNGTDCESWQCYYCPYCGSVEAVCVCLSQDQLPDRQKPVYRVAIVLPLTSRTIGQCTFAEVCTEELSNATANCSSVPVVKLDSISPTSGPASGGTLLTIKGAFLTALTKIVVGDSSCDLYSFRMWQTNSTAYCLLAGAKQAVNTTAAVRYSAIGRPTETNVATGLRYTFLSDPIVLDITPRGVITSQTRMVVQGANLASVSAAFLIATSTESNTTAYAPCVVVSNSSLSCGCPVYGVEGDNATYNLSVYLDGFRNVSLANGPGSSTVPITLNPDPVLDTFPSVGLLYVLDPDYGGSENGANIVISGSGLSAVNSSRYLILIGNGTTCVVASVDEESLTCTPSSLTPSDLGDNYTTYIGQHAPSIVVTIADSDYEMFIGYVMFYERRNAYIILSVACGALGLAGIILVLALTLQIRRERAMKRKAGFPYDTKKISAATTFDAWL